MAVKAGAGASVFSGADYQARIGGYLLVTSICGVESAIVRDRQILSLAFETSEAVDDINVRLADGAIIYIQAKAKIDFSTSRDSELTSVLEQFEQQHRSRPHAEDQYFLITSSRSSRRITYDMRAGLEAFRLGTEERFRRDQPQALVEIIDNLLRVIRDLQIRADRAPDDEEARAALRKVFVLTMDIDRGDAIEQGILLILQAKNFAAPTALWGKIVADCMSHAKSRHTVNISAAVDFYERFRVEAGQLPEQASNDLLRIEFDGFDFAVGREVILCRVPAEDGTMSGPVIMELYRFDDDCAERTEFAGNTCKLLNGMEVSLLGRAATCKGITRLIEANPSLIGEEQVTIIPINSDEDYEKGVCAETHRERLRQAALGNPHPLQCIHCGRPVSSTSAPVVEAGRGEGVNVGLSHLACLAPNDRVLGTILSQFFEEYPELINFDINAWFHASHGGQTAFANAALVRAATPIVAWGGRRRRRPEGPFVVELLLRGGGREFAASRDTIDRYSKAEADNFVARLNKQIQERGSSDPLCYSEHTRTFGPRSVLIEQLGGEERLLVIERARVRNYDERFAARYTRPDNWYAPLLYLRDLATGDVFSILGSVVLLTAPLSLGNYLDNWRGAGIPIPNYETVSLLTDRAFDDFMLWLEDSGRAAIVDPMVESDTSTRFVRGIPIQSVETIMAGALDE